MRSSLPVGVGGLDKDTAACSIRWMDADEQRRQADVILEATVRSPGQSRPYFAGTTFEYDVDVSAVMSGRFAQGRASLEFNDLGIHRRGEMTVCPLKHGSGIEHQLEPGRRYRMYLRTQPTAEILLAEPIR